MLRPVNLASTLAAGLLVLAALQVSAASEQESKQSEPMPGYEWLYQELRLRDWQPSLAVTSGFTVQRQKASVDSTIDDADGAAIGPLQESADGRTFAVSPYVGVNAELMTAEIPGGIRFFVNGEYLPTFGADLDVAKEGDPKVFDVPDNRIPIESPPGFPPNPCEPHEISTVNGRLVNVGGNGRFGDGCSCPFGFGCFSEEGITGVGARTTATVEQGVFGAAIGVAVPAELFGRKLMLKASFGWIRYEVNVTGAVLRAFKPPYEFNTRPQFDQDHPFGPRVNSGSLKEAPIPVIRLVELHDSSTQAFNAIGPGLELEMEVVQAGPIQTSLFLDARGYRVLGDRKVRLSASTSASCPSPVLEPPPGFPFEPGLPTLCNIQFGYPALAAPGEYSTPYSADWSFEIDPWLYRIGLGFRFRWTGE